MKRVAVEATRATVELSIEELDLPMNALWQDLGCQGPGRGRLEEDLRAGYDALEVELQDVIDEMDALAAGDQAAAVALELKAMPRALLVGAPRGTVLGLLLEARRGAFSSGWRLAPASGARS